MALILKNATFNDMEGLEKVISLFKKGSITPFALSSELTIAARDVVALRNDVYIEVVKENRSGGKSFGMAMLPTVSESKLDLYLYIDTGLFNILSEKEILEGILYQLENYNDILVEFSKFNTKKLDFDIDIIDALIETMKLYKMSLEKLYRIPNLKNVNCPVELDEIIEKLETESMSPSQAIEFITLGKYLPEEFIEAAKKIVLNNKNFYGNLGVEQKQLYKTEFEETPTIDEFYPQFKSYADKNFLSCISKEIDPDYEPDTNQ